MLPPEVIIAHTAQHPDLSSQPCGCHCLIRPFASKTKGKIPRKDGLSGLRQFFHPDCHIYVHASDHKDITHCITPLRAGAAAGGLPLFRKPKQETETAFVTML